MRRLGIILQFLTRFYIPIDFKALDEDITNGLPFFSTVGLILGALLFVLSLVLYQGIRSSLMGAMLLLMCWVVLTGGLHLDGVADSADGLFSGRGRERILEIMKDSHIGAFGVVALMAVLGLKFVALVELFDRGNLMPILVAPVIARGIAVYIAGIYSYARTEGMGNFFIGKVQKSDILINTVVMLVVLLLFWQLKAILFALATLGAIWFMTQKIDVKLKGITGDVLGLVIESAELIFILLWAL